MKKSLMVALVSAFLGIMSTNALGWGWNGTGNNYGSGWSSRWIFVELDYGTGNNYGSGWSEDIFGERDYGTGNNYGSGWSEDIFGGS